MPKHPDQPIELVRDEGPIAIVRFKKNAIVEWLSQGKLNAISVGLQNGTFKREDYVQLMQLIGYSVGGYCDLPFVSNREKDRAYEASDALLKSKKAKKRKPR